MEAESFGLGWEIHPNNDYRTLHSRVEVPRFGHISAKDETDDAKHFKTLLMVVPGVVEAYSYWRYAISIRKGFQFSWDEVCPAVEAAVLGFFNKQPVTGAEPDQSAEPSNEALAS